MKHNKKRNTAFLYECLIKELTRAIVREDKKRQLITKKVIKEFFNKNSMLRKELTIYNSQLESRNLERDFSIKLLEESRKDFYGLDRKEIFNAQTTLINRINKSLGHSVFSNFVPNYKDLATLSQLFDDDVTVKDRVLLEKKIIENIVSVSEKKEEMRAIVVQNGTVKVITDVNGYYSASTSHQGENALKYALDYKSNPYYKKYQLIIA